MKFIPCKLPKRITGGRHDSKQALVIESEALHTYSLKVEDEIFADYNKMKNFCSAFNVAAKKLNKPHMRARIINKEIYIINDLVSESLNSHILQ